MTYLDTSYLTKLYIDEPGAGAKVAAAIFGTATERKEKSVAICVPSDTARVRGVCSQVPALP